MRIVNIFAAFVMIFSSTAVLAVDPPKTTVGSVITRVGGRVSLQCVSSFEDKDSGQRHQTAGVELDLRKKIPDYDTSGFKMTGGGCEQYFGTIPPGMIPGYMIRNAPTGDAIWSCIVSDQPGWPDDNVTGGPFYRVRGHATACRNVVQFDSVEAPAPLNTNDGNQYIVARRGAASHSPSRSSTTTAFATRTVRAI